MATYISETEFRTYTGMQAADVSSTGFTTLNTTAHSFVVFHFGTWAGTEGDYGMVQAAEAYLTAHFAEIRSMENPPDKETNINETSTKWLKLYKNICLELTGKVPFQRSSDYGGSGLGGGGSFNASFVTVTPDEDSYTTSTTR
jgi:hypothetical protein